MSESFENKLNLFQEQASCESLDSMMKQLISQYESGQVSQETLKHMFFLYEVRKQVQSTESVLIAEFARLGIDEIKDELQECKLSDIPIPLTKRELLKDASISEFPTFPDYESFIASDFFKEYYNLSDVELEGKWFWGIEQERQIKIVSFQAIIGEVPEVLEEIDPQPEGSKDTLYKLIDTAGLPDAWRKQMIVHKLVSQNISEQERKYVVNLQRMLIVLGYLDRQEFTDAEDYGEGYDQRETNKLYYGRLGQVERQAILDFQRHMGFYESDDPEKNEVDGIVGPKTKPFFYKRIYEVLHS